MIYTTITIITITITAYLPIATTPRTLDNEVEGVEMGIINKTKSEAFGFCRLPSHNIYFFKSILLLFTLLDSFTGPAIFTVVVNKKLKQRETRVTQIR
jgi:hypothetical protein